MNSQENEFEALDSLIRRAVTERQDIVSGRKIAMPQQIPAVRQNFESRFRKDFPVLQYLDQALSLAMNFNLFEITERFSQVVDKLRWSQNPSYDDSNSTRSFLDGYAYAGLSGPDAPILCAVPRGGMILLGPDVVYPDHHHESREVYLVLTPGSQWCLDEGDWFDVAPGDLLFHDSWQMHAMRTRDKPLLAYASWLDTGDRRAIRWSDTSAVSGCD